MAVLRELMERDGLAAVAVAGYSLGGNLALRMAGEYGDDAPRQLKAFAAVSPTLDLAACVAALERAPNWLYQWNFVRDLKQRVRRKARLYPDIYPTRPLRALRTVREFDDRYTAPMSGFESAADYYHRASALRLIDRVARPTLIIAADDDPFVPVDQFREPAVTGNPNLKVIVTRHGGHCGFVEARRDGQPGDGYWAERTIVRFVEQHTPPLP
jgi:predicted alpha/beta-fold hydrolase